MRHTKQPVFIVVTIVIFYLPSLPYAWILRTVPRNNHLPPPLQHPPFTFSPLHCPSWSRNHRCVFHDTTTTTNIKARSVLWSLPPIVPVPEDDNHDDDDNDENLGERELVRAGRRNRRTAAREVQGPPNSSSNYNEHDFDTWENSAGRRVDQDDENDEDDEDYLYDDEDDDDWMDENDMGTISYDLLLEDVIIPNPLLDSMDPDGAADRFPELIRDPKFWLDMVLFLAFLDFLSAAGPQSNPFPDLPWFY
jgi:hypothetical protein